MLRRESAVAGSFYPKEKEELFLLLGQYLKKAKRVAGLGKLKILLSPHAGLFYSGPTASWGYKQIEGKDYQLVILLGASHYQFFDFAALWPSGFWQTPLGQAKVDKQLAKEIIDERYIKGAIEPHIPEHSLEMQLLFLQKILPQFTILPILVSEVGNKLLALLTRKLSKILKKEKTLLVVSSDLSHYPSAELAKIVDKKTIEAILSGKRRIFEKTLKELENTYPQVETFACGAQAIRVGLAVGQKLGLKWRLFGYQNSADIISGDFSSVVGYTSIGAYW